jgi:hypothetical protein
MEKNGAGGLGSGDTPAPKKLMRRQHIRLLLRTRESTVKQLEGGNRGRGPVA